MAAPPVFIHFRTNPITIYWCAGMIACPKYSGLALTFAIGVGCFLSDVLSRLKDRIFSSPLSSA